MAAHRQGAFAKALMRLRQRMWRPLMVGAAESLDIALTLTAAGNKIGANEFFRDFAARDRAVSKPTWANLTYGRSSTQG
jgi:hypothetical protein